MEVSWGKDGYSYFKTVNETHFILIKALYQFMYNQTKHKEKKHFCMYCLQQFSSLEVLNMQANCMVISGKHAEERKKYLNVCRFGSNNRKSKRLSTKR